MTALRIPSAQICFHRGDDNGAACWYYVKVPAEYLEAFSALSSAADPRQYGTVLESGLGDFPPQDVIAFMREEYGCVTPSRPL